MLFSILANLIVWYGLAGWPTALNQTIDVSSLAEQGVLQLVKQEYVSPAPYRSNNSSLGMKISGRSAVIMDVDSGNILWQKNPVEIRPLASITKLMTALVFLEHNPGWDSIVTIQPSDYREGGRIYVYNGEQITARDLFNASLVASSNNATVALARSTGLSEEEFTAAMNQRAKDLGMADSFFVEPTGLDPANVSTAADITALASYALKIPEISQATVQSEYTFKVINTDRSYTLESTDKLLGSYLDILAGKTGYLEEAGYCLVNQVQGPAGQKLLVTVLGSETAADRFLDVKALAQWAFDNYVWPGLDY